VIKGALRIAISVTLVAAIALTATIAWRRSVEPKGLTGGPQFLVAERERQVEMEANCLKRPCSAETARDLALDALRAEPVAAYPFALAAFSAARAGRTEEAAGFASRAIARDPRNVISRAVRAEAAFARKDYTSFLSDAERLLAIEPKISQTVVEAIAAIGADPKGLAALETWIATKPAYADAVVRQLAALDADPRAMVRLTRLMPNVQAEYLSRLVDTAGPEAAFRAWFELLPPSAAKQLTWPYNASFTDTPGAPPFNWRLVGEQAEIRPKEGLTATYFGKGRQTIADQLMLLRPGAYQFSAQMDGDVVYGGGGFVWSVACVQGNSELGAAALAPTSAGPGSIGAVARRPSTRSNEFGTIAFSFTVPAEKCPVQRLSLEGRPGEFPKRGRSQTSWVRIQPTPAAALATGAPL